MGQNSGSVGKNSPEAFGVTLPHDEDGDDAATSTGDTWLPEEAHEATQIAPGDAGDGGEPGSGEEPWTREALPVIRPDQRYALAGELARGGLGRILKAYDRRLARPIVIKELLRHSTDSVKRFLREAQITARLEHPSIVPLYDVGRWPDDVVFYSMKLVDGPSLDDRIKATKSLEERIALVPKLVAVAEAIAYAHSHGVLHRDLKPQNILVGYFGETLVIDWGLAKYLHEDSDDGSGGGPFRVVDPELTAVGAVMGTPAFMPPEQARGESVDAGADVYAIGSILYFMLAGCAPYNANDGEVVLERLIAGPPPPLVEREPDVPPDLLAIVDKAMQRDPDRRYPSAKELSADLRRFQTGQLVGARRYSPVDLARRWLQRHRALVAISALALAMLGAAGVVSVNRIAQERDLARQKSEEVELERTRAVTAQQEAVERGDQLVLLQAKSQLAEDPTAALAWLKQYPSEGGDWPALVEIAEQAHTAGFASAVWSSPQPLRTVSFSKDGTRLALGGVDPGVDVYTLDGSAVVSIPDFAARALAVHFVAGGSLAILGSDRTLRLWDGGASPPRVIATFGDRLQGMANSDGDRRLLVAAADGDLRVFDVVDGQQWSLEGQRGQLHSAAFSPDGEQVATAGEDGIVRMWHIGKPTPRTLRLSGPLTWVDWSAGGETLFVGLRSGTIERRSLDGRLLARLEGHRGPVTVAALSPDGTRLATGSADKSARLWTLSDGSSHEIKLEGPVSSVEFSPDGKLLAVSGIDRTVRLVRLSGTARELRGHDGPVWKTTFSPDGRWLATASEDCTLRIWPITAERGHTVGRHSSPFSAIARSPDQWRVATASKDGAIGMFDGRLDRWETLPSSSAASIRSLAFVASADRLVALHDDGDLRLWTQREERWQGEPLGRLPNAAILASAPHTANLAVVTTDGRVSLWSEEFGLRQVAASGVDTELAMYSPDGRVLAVAGVDGSVVLYDQQGDEVKRLQAHRAKIRSIAFSPDSRQMATASYDGTVRLWRDGGESHVLQGHLGPVLIVTFAKTGDRLASAGVDGIVRLWDPATGELVDQAPIGGAITAVALSPQNSYLAAAGYQGELRLYDLENRRPYILREAVGVTQWVRFAPDGRRLLAAGDGGHLRLWELDERGGVPAGPPTEPDEVREWLKSVSTAVIASPEEPIPLSPPPSRHTREPVSRQQVKQRGSAGLAPARDRPFAAPAR